MRKPGLRALLMDGGDFQITSAGNYVGDWITNLEGMETALITVEAAFAGTGNAGIKVFIQTDTQGENSAVDVACVKFTDTSETKIFKLSRYDGIDNPGDNAPITSGKYLQLAEDTVLPGIIGRRMRAVVQAIGAYTATTISVRAILA